MKAFAKLSPKDYILIKDAHTHNLKHIDVAIPRCQLVVITGLSGSGKSSLAFDTLFAEGQRRYVESLSAYARQFLEQMEKPAVEYIKGLSPAVAIEQKVSTRNIRSTVGTSTEIYEYIKLLFTRIGKTISPISGKEVKRHTVKDVLQATKTWEQRQRFMVAAPLLWMDGDKQDERLSLLLQQGYSRLLIKGEVVDIQEVIARAKKLPKKQVSLLIDRLSVEHDSKTYDSRLADSAQTAFYESKGYCQLYKVNADGVDCMEFSNKFALDGMDFVIPTPHFFTFNNPFGACKSCGGTGTISGIDEHLVIPNKTLSVYDNAVACWRGEKLQEWRKYFIIKAAKYKFPAHKAYWQLSEQEKDLLWNGSAPVAGKEKEVLGINDFFDEMASKMHKIQNRIILARYRGRTECVDCQGTRLRKDASYVKVGGKSIQELVRMPLYQLQHFFNTLQLSSHDAVVSERLLTEINKRLASLNQLGLGYLTLNRQASTLSGGESQRINLSTCLSSNLVGAIYVLDEPSIGLHSRDTQKLIAVLQSLKRLGNTVVVVEHDEEIMTAADYVIDMGPLAGLSGGEIVFAGNQEALMQDDKSLTAAYLQGKKQVAAASSSRPMRDYIYLKGALVHNLKNIDISFPPKALTVVTGVSGSGKSSLIKEVLYPTLSRYLGEYGVSQTQATLSGELQRIRAVEMIDQSSVSTSSRSNAATYLKAWDDIRQLLASTRAAKLQGLGAGDFSFNVPGGRCETCEGEGVVKVEMQFMADIHLRCDSCKGKRFQDRVLDVKVEGKNVYDLLSMSIDEVIMFFEKHQKQYKQMSYALSKLYPLQEVGLGYVHLGQSSSTYSGGEAQRLKLAYYLAKKNSTEPMLFIFDEPTTGLHFHDIDYLLKAFYALLALGHTVIVIEHHLDVIRNADWVIDMGPEGGEKGGYVVFEGKVEQLLKVDTLTAQALKKHLHKD